jgi:hypothetical protein
MGKIKAGENNETKQIKSLGKTGLSKIDAFIPNQSLAKFVG